MAEQKRETLKNHFKVGQRPTQQAFEDLIDSNLNMIDEGIRKTDRKGLALSQIDQGRLISMNRKDTGADDWNVRLDDLNTLIIGTESTLSLLKLFPDGRIEIYGEAVRMDQDPESGQANLEIQGEIRSCSRRGTYQSPDKIQTPVLADGKWHDLIKNISGCCSFEIMAGARNPKRQRYALLHAVAQNANNPESIFNRYFKSSNIFLDFFRSKKKIASHHAYYNQKCDKLRLRWITPDTEKRHLYTLQIKTNCDFKDKTEIRYHITRLWDDSFFNEPTEQKICRKK